MAIKDGAEYARFMTQRLVDYMDTPRELRKQARVQAKSVREHWVGRWFGWAGYGVLLWWRKNTATDPQFIETEAQSGIQLSVPQHLVESNKS